MIRILIIVAVVLIAALILFALLRARRVNTRDADLTIDATPSPPPPRPAIADSRDDRGQGLDDQIAAAMKDIAGEMAGVEAQPDTPGDDELSRDTRAPASIAAGGDGDELVRIKGLGPKAADRLKAMGIVRFEQIASWDDAEAERIEGEIGMIKGRVARDKWVEQAGCLARGDTAGFEQRFGKLG